MAVKIVTDSTSDIPPALAQQLDITVVPLTVFFGDEAFKDGVEMTHDEFFRRLTTSAVFPRTTQPSPADFVHAYRPLVEQGHEIVSMHISGKLSGTMNSALSARQELPDARIELVDTGLGSLALGLAVKAAAEAAQRGEPIEAVLKQAREASESIELYVVLDTLEYLHRGGRIGKAQSLMGSLLSLKPILTLVDGEIHPYEKVRTRQKAVQRLLDLAVVGAPYKEIAIAHVTTSEEVARFTGRLAPLTDAPVLVGEIGPVVGAYAGPRAVGVALRK